jgi:hypothetical protein
MNLGTATTAKERSLQAAEAWKMKRAGRSADAAARIRASAG